MYMQKRKASGFFIVEILIVLAIIAILVTALLPNLSTYTKRAKFADVLTVANSLKPSIELCVLQNATAGSAIPSNTCNNGTNGVPADTTSGYATNVSGFSTSSTSVITATGAGTVAGVTYILTPTYNSNGTISWVPSGTCATQGLC